MSRNLIIIALAASALTLGCKNEVFQWRGPDRNGIFPESGLMDQWPDNGPELKWAYEGLGRGFAGPVVTDKMIFVNGEQEGKSYLFALDLEGTMRWKSPNGEEFLGEGFSSTYPGARSTPTVLGNLVYTTSGTGRIACFDASTGAEKWSLHIVKDLGGWISEFGYTESLVVDGDKVYCFPGGTKTNMAALDRFTGKTVWTSEVLRDTFAYGSPVLANLPGGKVLIATSRHYLVTVDPGNGELLASYPLEGYEFDGEHCNTPVYVDGYLYFVGNDETGQGAMRLELTPDGKGIKEVWRNPGIRNNFGGLVVVDHHLYTTLKGNELVCLEPEHGSVVDSIRVSTGSLAYADHKFFCYGNNGSINLVTRQGGSFENKGSMKVTPGTGQHFSHPVIAGGVMYIRHGDALAAYRVQ